MAKKQTQAEEDAAIIGKLLECLTWDMLDQPPRIQRVPTALVARGKALVESVKVDLDQSLAG
ncbi:type II toxin-antitoxin system PrlF family antitoxin (plasmid) [Nitrobacter sp. NHB1]|uniref:type II toxin-antitoxin system PrlF family antitoxin n=1 Tax=Nitrobacter sp. NHB1 TaxID=3119830 RepID=UPI002FFF933F